MRTIGLSAVTGALISAVIEFTVRETATVRTTSCGAPGAICVPVSANRVGLLTFALVIVLCVVGLALAGARPLVVNSLFGILFTTAVTALCLQYGENQSAHLRGVTGEPAEAIESGAC